MTFLFVLLAGPRVDAAETVAGLSSAAMAMGHEVQVFLAGDGVAHAGSLGGRVSVTLCEADLRWRQSNPPEMAGVRRGSLADLARLTRSADRVLVFS